MCRLVLQGFQVPTLTDQMINFDTLRSISDQYVLNARVFFSLNVMAEPNFRCMMILILYALFICRITQFIVINCVIWMKTGQILNIFFCYLVIKVYLLYRTKKCNQANKWVSSLKLFRLELAGVFLGSEFSFINV